MADEVLGKVIALTSGKGGVGKTTVAAGVAQALCEKGYKVLAIDGDLDFRNLDMVIGLSDNFVFDLNDVIAGNCDLTQAVYKSTFHKRLYFLAGTVSQENMNRATPAVIKDFLEHLKKYFDYIVVDTAAGSGKSFEIFTQNADIVVVVTTLYKAAIRDGEKIATLVENEDGEKQIYMLVNMVDDKLIIHGHAPDIDMIIDSLSVPLIGLLPVEQQLIVWQNRGDTIHRHKAMIKIQMDDIASRLCGDSVPLKKFWK